MLRQHPKIECFGEDLVPGVIKNDQKAIERIEEIFSGNDIRIRGLKVKYEQMLQFFPGAFQYLLERKDLLFLHLRRRNLLKRFVSQEFATRNQGHFSQSVHNEKVPEKRKLNIKKCLSDMWITEHRSTIIQQQLLEKRHIDLYYERLARYPVGVLHSLTKSLDLEEHPYRVPTKKILSDDLQHVLANYEQVRWALSFGPYRHHLDDPVDWPEKEPTKSPNLSEFCG